MSPLQGLLVAVTSTNNMVCCSVSSNKYQSISPPEFILLSIVVAMSPNYAILRTDDKLKESNGLDFCKNSYRKIKKILFSGM